MLERRRDMSNQYLDATLGPLRRDIEIKRATMLRNEVRLRNPRSEFAQAHKVMISLYDKMLAAIAEAELEVVSDP